MKSFAVLREDLRQWFDPKHPKGGWKRINSKGEAIGPCTLKEGVWKTIKTLRKEATELMQETDLTPGEEKKKEKYVRGMKKNIGDFRSRYGERSKEVMYATATKMAKESE